jgi:hypothetical protein
MVTPAFYSSWIVLLTLLIILAALSFCIGWRGTPQFFLRVDRDLIIEKGIHGARRLAHRASHFVSRLQTGCVQHYTAALALGACLLLYLVLRKV